MEATIRLHSITVENARLGRAYQVLFDLRVGYLQATFPILVATDECSPSDVISVAQSHLQNALKSLAEEAAKPLTEA